MEKSSSTWFRLSITQELLIALTTVLHYYEYTLVQVQPLSLPSILPNSCVKMPIYACELRVFVLLLNEIEGHPSSYVQVCYRRLSCCESS